MKLVVSIMPRSLEEAQQLDSSRYEDADVIEWRADFLEKSEILTCLLYTSDAADD